ncbi:MAG: amidohydrolase family protein [Pseudomonadales bacterium]
MRIDTAVSFWKKDAPSPADEPLILHQDYLPQHLGFVLIEHGLTGVIAIQHAERNPSTEEWLTWMEECTQVIAVVALVTSDSLPSVPEWVTRFPKLRAIRTSLSGLANDDQYRQNLIAALNSLDVTLEIAVDQALPESCTEWFENAHRQRIVLAPKLTKDGDNGLLDVAFIHAWTNQHPNLWIKLDGLPNLTSTDTAESSWDDPEDAMLDASKAVTFVAHLLDSELTERLVWGSAWPALTAQFTFDEAIDILDTCLQGKPEVTKTNLLGANVIDAYGLSE